MSRGLLMGLLALNLFVMGSSLYLMWHRWQKNVSRKSASATLPATPAQVTPQVQKQPAMTATTTPTEPLSQEKIAPKPETTPPKKLTPKRKVLFQYRDSIPQRVSIIGDFNQWSPQLMKKGNGHLWTITLELEPGNYAYNFVVDGRVIRDPNNKKTKQANQKIPSSFLVIQSPKASAPR